MIRLNQVSDILFRTQSLDIDKETLTNVDACYKFLETFAQNKVIYGINTGFGPMAQWRVADKDLHALQYNIIRSHSTGAGEPLEDIYARSYGCAHWFVPAM